MRAAIQTLATSCASCARRPDLSISRASRLMKTIVALMAGIASLSGCKQATVDSGQLATRVVISDLEHREIRVLTGPAELAAFNAQWLAKRDTGKQGGLPTGTFQFFVDVNATAGGGRWLYAADGSTTKLDHKAHALYQVSQVQEFNRALGVGE